CTRVPSRHVVQPAPWPLVRNGYFFFQAEDGIRYRNVTGVQTCALPISPRCASASCSFRWICSRRRCAPWRSCHQPVECGASPIRSEERRVGKECRSRRWRGSYEKKKLFEVKCDVAAHRTTCQNRTQESS